MNIQEVKDLLSKLETYSVDTQPLRDLIVVLQRKRHSIDKYIPILETIKLVLDTSNIKLGTSSLQLNTIMELLNNKILEPDQEDLPNKKNVQTQSLDRDKIIMSALLEIKKDLDLLKTKETTVINNISNPETQELEGDSSLELKPVYIEHTIDTSNIKSNFNIDSKVESNINSKLDRLKQLKRK